MQYDDPVSEVDWVVDELVVVVVGFGGSVVDWVVLLGVEPVDSVQRELVAEVTTVTGSVHRVVVLVAEVAPVELEALVVVVGPVPVPSPPGV